ncbi:hypothetical protein D6D28_03252 [Aureobasidium pullulans]|uniref:Uncharacterized protein n=1 Tax=Aureobasidium pullulans TaxID=5580 RepID=A0A4S8SRK5_AURPU|nr:hypothetical protein D6D28_03252 [Aureobasidium pullulans]
MTSQLATYPIIPLNLREHKKSIAVHFSVLVFFTSILPVVLYFILKYGASLSPHTTFIIILPVIGLPALLGFVVRTYKLIRFQDYRPLGCDTWWTFDYFHFNFILGIIYVVILFTFGNTEDETNMRLLSLYLPLVMFQLSGQFILVRLLDFCGLRTPFRISSSPKGSSIPSGAAVVAEDIIAVDGSCKAEFRAAWQARLAISPAAARTAVRMDWLWGVSGLSCGAVLMVIVFTADNPDVGFALAWTIPIVWGAIMAYVTTQIIKKTTALERQHFENDGVERQNFSSIALKDHAPSTTLVEQV